MKIRIIVLFVMIFGTVIVLAGCGPELIDCPNDSGESITAKVGRTEDNALYEFGAVLVYYDWEVQQQMDMTDDIPFSPVNAFFKKKGYTPRVKGFIFDGEVISLGSDVDTYPMLKDLSNIPGVQGAYPHVFFKTSELLYRSSLDYEPLPSDGDLPPSVKRAIIEVGILADGTLYELGVVLIKYDEMHTANTNPAEVVDTFFRKKGYAPRTMDSISGYGYKVMHVGDCVDTALMLEELKAIPGVADARLNQLHTILEVAKGESDVPGVSPF